MSLVHNIATLFVKDILEDLVLLACLSHVLLVPFSKTGSYPEQPEGFLTLQRGADLTPPSQ